MMNLQDYIGESSQYDKKQQVEKRKPKSWLKSISAFANGQGGKLIFGVLEDNSVVGLENFQKDSEDVSELIKSKVDPIPEFDLEFTGIGGKVIMTISVYPGRNTPYYVVDGGSKIAYTRVGNESIPVSSIQLTQLALRGQQKTYDELVTDIHIENADFSKLKSLYYQRVRKNFMELGSEIHVDMFDDRLEIYSPGGMVDGTKIQDKDINLLSSKRRNPILADVFSRMNLMERRGSGLRKILDSYMGFESYSEKLLPKFQSTNSEFIVILQNLNYHSGDKKWR